MADLPLTLLALAAAAVPQAGGPPSPISLSVETGAAGVEFRVVGRSPTPVAASYMLEVAGGGNRNVQRGSVRLQPDRPVTLLTTRLGGSAGENWRARLVVTPEKGAPYEVLRQADRARPTD